jgi:signal recognition particle subunit SRP54
MSSPPLREVRTALLEADVSLPVTRDFIKRSPTRPPGPAVTKSITPGQQVVKIVHDELIRVLAGRRRTRSAEDRQPACDDPDGRPAGLGQDHHHRETGQTAEGKERQAVLMASLDTNRPAAMEQLAILGAQIGVDTCPSSRAKTPSRSPSAPRQQATLGGYDVVFAGYRRPSAHRRSADGRGSGGPRHRPRAKPCWSSTV